MNRFLIGSLAGFAATAAMTLAIGAMYGRLPKSQRYPLLPREITTKITEELEIDRHLNERQRVHAALISHFAFGAAAGALYPYFARGTALPPVINGIAYGVVVWAASYLGWLPALRILRPATQHPAGRNILMILAHVVWGSATGVIADRLERAGSSFLAGGETRDVPRK